MCVQKKIISETDRHDYSISVIRLVAIICIITCHMMQYFGFVLAWWFNVGVQIFLCISGFLYGQKRINNSVLNFYKKRFVKILKPYYITVVFAIVIEIILLHGDFDYVHGIATLLLRSSFSGAGHLWFIPVILMCYVITPLLNAVRDRDSQSG